MNPTTPPALSALSRSLDQHRLAHANALQATAPLFTPFTYLRKDEYSISRIIGDLLDPNGRPSQGRLFLSLFLDTFGFPSLEPIAAQARVTTEDRTVNGDWFFCVELDSGAGSWCYGLKLLTPNGLKSKAMFNLGTRYRDRFVGAEGPNDHWLFWLWFDNRTAHDPASYLQWEDDVQPWVDMADGTMAANFAILATELHQVSTELR